MSRRNTTLLKAALKTMRWVGADRLAEPWTAGAGVVFMLHHVAPDTGKDFEPNRILRVTPEFLDSVLTMVSELGFDTVSLDDVPERLARARGGDTGSKPFACFTFDDGYRDNRDHALPVFKRHGAPFTVYVPTDYADGQGDLWWLVLEQALREAGRVRVPMAGGNWRTFETGTTEQKNAAYHEIYWWLRQLPEVQARGEVAALARSVGVDAGRLCRDLVMDWDELRAFSDEPLVTIGAHTKSHRALAKLPEDEARDEMAASIARIEDELARPCHHFSYPYGSEDACGPREYAIARELGVATAVTTRKGLLRADMSETPEALPRLSLNGDFQEVSYVRTLLTGAPFALMQALKPARGILAGA